MLPYNKNLNAKINVYASLFPYILIYMILQLSLGPIFLCASSFLIQKLSSRMKPSTFPEEGSNSHPEAPEEGREARDLKGCRLILLILTHT